MKSPGMSPSRSRFDRSYMRRRSGGCSVGNQLKRAYPDVVEAVNRQTNTLRACLFLNPPAAVPLRYIDSQSVGGAFCHLFSTGSQPQQPVVTPQLPPPSAVPPVAPSLPLYRMNSELRTVRQLWDEWFTGLNGIRDGGRIPRG
jgi:hypothetical protein